MKISKNLLLAPVFAALAAPMGYAASPAAGQTTKMGLHACSASGSITAVLQDYDPAAVPKA